MRRRAALMAALGALTLWAGAALAQDGPAAPADRAELERSEVPRLPPGGDIADLVSPARIGLPLELLRGAAAMVEGALRQAEGIIVPIRPDAVLGREDDPLGKGGP